MTIRVLVVDDSMALRQSVVEALQRLRHVEGFRHVECVEAGDGAEAIKKFEAAHFDLVVTDINMPVLDGLKLTFHIRQGSGRPEVPIVIISTEAGAPDRERALRLGANAYLVKPVTADDVIEAVARVLRPVAP